MDNALMAGNYGLLIMFVIGDKAVREQAEKLLGNVESLTVKYEKPCVRCARQVVSRSLIAMGSALTCYS